MSLKPLYDSNVDLVAWIDLENNNIFNTNLDWIAFISEGNVFSSNDISWLGPIKKTTCFDTNGHPILWNPDNVIESIPSPYRPFQPYRPYRPFRPYTPFTPSRPFTPYRPSGGWSNMSFKQWINS